MAARIPCPVCKQPARKITPDHNGQIRMKGTSSVHLWRGAVYAHNPPPTRLEKLVAKHVIPNDDPADLSVRARIPADEWGKI